MRLVPSTPASWFAATAGVVLTAGALLIGCTMLPLDSETGGLAEADPTPTPAPTAEETLFTVPQSCADAGAAELVGDLAPAGAVVQEDSAREEAGPEDGVEEDAADAEQLACAWSAPGTTEPDSESLTLVFAVNLDPSDRAAVVRLPGELEEMNWEVDVDVDVDSYHTPEADQLGGELKSVATADGSSRHLSLSLPGDFHILVIAMFSDASQEEMERVLITAAERARA